jgi:acetoin utilization deacetylase AcuC-like enzyme
MGFCFFNNNAVAAQWALDHRDVDRVAILDWDVHHGNGIQDIFYDRGDVFFASFHEEGIYPGTGVVDETGEGDGARRTLNVPFPPGTQTSGYLAALDDLVLPALAAYDPDLLLVSAGFDAHEHDPISRIRVSTEGYGLMAQRLQKFAEWAGAPLGFVLEGGYGLDTLTDSIKTVHEVFHGYQPEPPDDPVQAGAESVIEAVREKGFDRVETPDFGPAVPTADPDGGDEADGDAGEGEAGDTEDAENAP